MRDDRRAERQAGWEHPRTEEQESFMTTELSTDAAAAAAVLQRIVRAWADQDGAAFANVFTAEGTMVLPGLYLKGRDDIRDAMSAAFTGPYKGTQVTGDPLDVRVDGDLGIIVSYGGVIPADEPSLPDDSAIRATWVVVREDGDWRLAAYQNSPA
jgi:uncharacterized protein (TIGR02246 family)